MWMKVWKYLGNKVGLGFALILKTTFMKYLLMLTTLLFVSIFVEAQTGGAVRLRRSVNKKAANDSNVNQANQGSVPYHGSKDTTPGSPMGTGGAGGGDMSGSSAGSAIGTQEQAGSNKTNNPNQNTSGKGANIRPGSRDTTPGSPIGTGGTGGGDMSGSPASSAVATKDQKSKAPAKVTKAGNRAAPPNTLKKRGTGVKRSTKQ